MDQSTNQIAADIEAARDDLGANLKELESKVKSYADWKQHFRTSPLTMIGVAFGSGIVLAAVLGGQKMSRGERARSYRGNSPESQATPSFRRSQRHETWDTMKGALIGVAATRVKDFIGEVIPGFSEQLRRREEQVKSL